MDWRKSFVIRIFLILLACFIVLLTMAGIGVYIQARQTVGMEFIRLNQSALNQMAGATGNSLAEAIHFCNRVAANNRILKLVKNPGENTEKEIHGILTALQGEFDSSHTNGASLTEVYVLGSDGLQVSPYHSELYSWKQIAEDPRCASLMDGSADVVLLPVHYEPRSKDVMTYSFQIVCPMRDLLNGEPQGFVVVNTSELLLFKPCSSFENGNTSLQIIDCDGLIQSGRDKRKIGTDYGWNRSQLESLRFDKRIKNGIVDGKLRLFAEIPASNWLLVEDLDEQMVFGTLIDVRNTIFLSIGVGAVLAIAAIAVLSRKLLHRVSRIRDGMEKTIQDDLSVRLVVEKDDEFGSIEDSFNAMVEEMNNLITTVRRSEQEKRVAEMDFLHAQINTHFIHNTLTSIRFMLEMGQTEDAGEMLFYFSKLLRDTLTRSSEFIPLSKEMDTLKSYVKLQWYRYRNAFEASYDIDEEVLNIQVPALILQPVVENAIFHGMEKDFIHIRISACKKDGNLLIVVEDDGVGMSDDTRKTILKKDVPLNHVGLRNVHERIQLCYGAEYGLRIDSQVGRGTKITFTLPAET